MNTSEANEYIQKRVKIILSNNFHFTGKVLSTSEDTLTIIDIYGQKVSVSLKDIIVCTEVLSQ